MEEATQQWHFLLHYSLSVRGPVATVCLAGVEGGEERACISGLGWKVNLEWNIWNLDSMLLQMFYLVPLFNIRLEVCVKKYDMTKWHSH